MKNSLRIYTALTLMIGGPLVGCAKTTTSTLQGDTGDEALSAISTTAKSDYFAEVATTARQVRVTTSNGTRATNWTASRDSNRGLRLEASRAANTATLLATLTPETFDYSKARSLAERSCKQEGETLTVPVSPRHTITRVVCGDSTRIDYLDQTKIGNLKDRFSAGGVSASLDRVRVVANEGDVILINFADPRFLAITLPSTTSSTGSPCPYPTVRIPSSRESSLSATTCPASQESLGHMKNLQAIKTSNLDGKNISDAFASAAGKIHADLKECQSALVRSTGPTSLHVQVTCKVDGTIQTAAAKVSPSSNP